MTEARCPSYFGLTGIVVQETTNAFRLVTPENQLKSAPVWFRVATHTAIAAVPKQGNIFTFQVGNAVVTLYGHNFLYRPAERTARKIKAKNTIELR